MLLKILVPGPSPGLWVQLEQQDYQSLPYTPTRDSNVLTRLRTPRDLWQKPPGVIKAPWLSWTNLLCCLSSGPDRHWVSEGQRETVLCNLTSISVSLKPSKLFANAGKNV